MDLDRELQRLLGDDRLDVPVRTGAEWSLVAAARRRRQRNGMLAATAAAIGSVLLVGGGVALVNQDSGPLPPARPPVVQQPGPNVPPPLPPSGSAPVPHTGHLVPPHSTPGTPGQRTNPHEPVPSTSESFDPSILRTAPSQTVDPETSQQQPDPETSQQQPGPSEQSPPSEMHITPSG